MGDMSEEFREMRAEKKAEAVPKKPRPLRDPTRHASRHLPQLQRAHRVGEDEERKDDAARCGWHFTFRDVQSCRSAQEATMKVGIAIDSWKLTIFDRRLTKAGFTYEKGPGIAANTMLLMVQTPSADALLVVVKAANTEAARCRKDA